MHIIIFIKKVLEKYLYICYVIFISYNGYIDNDTRHHTRRFKKEEIVTCYLIQRQKKRFIERRTKRHTWKK